MANSLLHAGLPYPIKGAKFSLALDFRTSAGALTDPTSPDTEISTDGGATFSDATNEITTGGSNGKGYITLTSTETNASIVHVAAKSANCLATGAVLYPRDLVTLFTATLSAGASDGGTLPSPPAYDLRGCYIRTTGGTGGGSGNNQARKISTYNTTTGEFLVVPDWEVATDNTTTVAVHLPEGATPAMVKALNATTPGRTLDVTTGGEAGIDLDNTTGALGTAQFDAGYFTAALFAAGALDKSKSTGWNDITAASVWAAGTRTLTAGTNIVLAKGTGVTGFNDLDAAGIRTAVGMAAANLDTQLEGIADVTNETLSNSADIKLVTDKLNTAIEVDGAVYRFTINALEQAPAGGGGGGDQWATDLSAGGYVEGTAGFVQLNMQEVLGDLNDNKLVLTAEQAAALQAWLVNNSGNTIDDLTNPAQVDNTDIVPARVFTLSRRHDGTLVANGTCRMRVGETYPVWINTAPLSARWLASAGDGVSSDPNGVSITSVGINQSFVVLWLTALAAGSYTVQATAHIRGADSLICELAVEVST
jgi:hypothetical protein